ncbi:MAG: type II secretion system protein [Planctomycetes bacterium]|nr:type II secretion system protein [Planctomycetota bacterium]
MKCFSKNSDTLLVCRRALGITQSDPRWRRRGAIRDTREKAFSLAETVAALVILAFVCSSVLVVFNRYMESAVDSVMRMRAFEVARDNMEELIASNSAQESVEYGNSERYPEIEWETSVETFYEPLTAKMWIQAVCSAEYMDSEGEVQKVELTHWLTDVTKSQLLQILAQRQEQFSGQAIETLEEAAQYADVDEQTIQQWVDNGMLLTKDGQYIMSQLDLYKDSDGNPTIEDRRRLAEADSDLKLPTGKRAKPGGPPGSEPDKQRKQSPPDDGLKRIGGYTPEELNKMPFDQIWKILSDTDEF